jgi:beta-N-acetylhexosaminidase
LDAIDREVASKQAVQLADEIAEHAITVVRNEAKLLPLNYKAGAKVFNLAITNGDDRAWITQPFVSAMGRGGVKFETVVLDDRSSDDEVAKAVEKAGQASVVFVSMYGRVRSGQARSVALPDPGTKALNELIERKTSLVGISFGNPYILLGFPKLQTYLVAYGDMPSLQQATARALLGQIEVNGRLPISLPGLYPRGAGMEMKCSCD